MTVDLNRALSSALGMLLAIGCGRADQKQDSKADHQLPGVTIDSVQAGAVKLAVATRTMFHPKLQTTGTALFNGERSTVVVSPISGPVSRLVVSLGDRVRPGQVLATVASPDFAAALSDFRKADLAWKNAGRIAELNEKLFATGALPLAERDQSASDLAQAAADRAASLAVVASLGLADSAVSSIDNGGPTAAIAPAIRAPIAGTVVERLITPGQLLEAGSTAAFTIADLSTMWVNANLFGADVGLIQVGDRAVISAYGGDSLMGRVEYIGAVVDPTTRATAVRIAVPNGDRRLRENMVVQVAIISDREREGVLVPVAALLRDNENQPYLFVAQGDNRFLRRPVTLGERVGDQYVITSGLDGGEQIVIDGGLYLSTSAAQ